MKEKLTIALDAMGGDFAPENVVKGAIESLKVNSKIDILLIGNSDMINEVLKKNGYSFPEDNIIHTEQVVEMKDSPTQVLKTKTNSSMIKCIDMVKNGEAVAAVSAGNTGAMLAASTIRIGRIKGVGRPTIGAPLPTINNNHCYVYDAGTNVDCKPEHLKEFAIMGSIYAKYMLGIEKPRVGLLSVGEEDSKGNEVSLKAFELIKQANLNFLGNVEGNDILLGKADLVVCDGFLGNVLLKFAESTLTLMKGLLRNYADTSLSNKIKVLLAKGTLKSALSQMDYQNYGGVPLLGVDGISIIGHGSSSPLAIRNMILKAVEINNSGLIQKFKETLSSE